MNKAKFFITTGVAAALLSVVNIGHAEDGAAGAISANVTLTTDYTFRGISQTGEKGAIQGGFDWSGESGLYAGIWGSNINFGGDASSEMDYYGGYAGELGNGIGYDLGFIYYDYEGESELDYLELAASVSFNNFSIGVNYSDEFGDGGPNYLVVGGGYSFALTENVGLDLHLGYNDLGSGGEWEAGEDSYIDYSVAVSTSFQGVGLSLSLIGTDLDDTDAADDRLVFAISREF